MSQSETIARPYARAIFAQANVEGSKVQWGEFLSTAASIIDNDSVMSRIQAPSFFDNLVSWVDQYLNNIRNSGLSEKEKNFLFLLKKNNRLSILPEIAEGYSALLNDENGHIQAIVYTAKKLNKAQEAIIEALLKKKTGKEVTLEIIEQPDLLAGIRIEYDGLVIEQSTKGRIIEFARKLDDLRN